MRRWALLLRGFLVWAAHFFGLYIIGSVFPGRPIAGWLTIILTFLALIVLALFALHLRRLPPDPADKLEGWVNGLTSFGIALGAVGVIYQGLSVLSM